MSANEHEALCACGSGPWRDCPTRLAAVEARRDREIHNNTRTCKQCGSRVPFGLYQESRSGRMRMRIFAHKRVVAGKTRAGDYWTPCAGSHRVPVEQE